MEDALRRQAQFDQAQKDLEAYRANFAAAASLWNHQLSQLSAKYPNERFALTPELTALLQKSNVITYNTNGVTTLAYARDRNIPVLEGRTKHFFGLLVLNLRKLSEKYPQIRGELDAEVLEIFNEDLLAQIGVDDLHRIVDIIRYVPQQVRVENVYAYSSEKSRRVEFHLRVLLKALLEELYKLKGRYNAVLDIDEGVIGMINQEIIDIVSVDDILKVFRTQARIVEVDRIVEKAVERVVEVPQVIPVERYVEKIVEVPKFIEVEKIVHVPVEVVKVVDNIVEKLVEVPTISEKVVEVPTVKEKIVQTKVEVPKIVEVEKIVNNVVVNTEVVTVEVPVHHTIPEYKEIVQIVEKAVPVERIVEKIVEVPVVIEKIVEKVVEVAKVVEVEVVREKIIAQKVVEVVGETQVAVREIIKEVPVYIEKLVPVETVSTNFVEVTKVIEKPVPVRSVETVIKEVEVIREKLVPVVQVKEVEKIKNVIVEKIK